MSFLCLNCDRDNIEYSFKYGHLLDLGKKIKKSTIKNIEFDKVDETLKNYITIYNKDYDIYFINFRFKLEFDNNYAKKIQTNCFHINNVENNDITLKYFINCYESVGYKF